MRVVVGATGNVGTSLLGALADEERVESVLGLARRVPKLQLPKLEWGRADVTATDLEPLFRGADVVVHLAWAIQPSRDEDRLRRVNVGGSARVFEAVAAAGVPALVYASSVGAYSPGPKHDRVDESWPVDGVTAVGGGRGAAEPAGGAAEARGAPHAAAGVRHRRAVPRPRAHDRRGGTRRPKDKQRGGGHADSGRDTAGPVRVQARGDAEDGEHRARDAR